MPTVVKTRIVKIGNSQGIRIPKLLLEQANLGKDTEVELELQPDQIIVRPIREVRQGWAAAFKRMAQQQDDRLLDAEVLRPTAWEADEWTW
jgi:antitoxin MazE